MMKRLAGAFKAFREAMLGRRAYVSEVGSRSFPSGCGGAGERG